jgi:hypothetical protein
MMELKVQCDCGQKYKFDVEPVNNRMPYAVACPICGADGTGKANAILQQTVVYQIPPPPSSPPPPPPPVPEPPKFRIGAQAGVPTHSTPPPISPLSATPAPLSRPVKSIVPPAATGAQSQPGRKPSFALGLLGGFLGALVGATIYYVIFKVIGYSVTGIVTRLVATFLALGVGGLAGWGAEFLGRGDGSKELGLITAILVVAGVIGAQYFVALGWWHQTTHGFEDAGFSMIADSAKEVVKAIPTGSDEEIRNYLAKEAAGEDDKPDPKAVSDDAVKQFREKQLPEYQDLASGKETKEQYFAKHGIDPAKMKKAEDAVEDTFQGLFLLLLLSKVGIFSLIASAGLAYKMSTNA